MTFAFIEFVSFLLLILFDIIINHLTNRVQIKLFMRAKVITEKRK